MLATSSVPSLTEFDPTIIPFQYKVIKDVRTEFDYSQGVQELLLSGSVGSSKSLLGAHLAVTHCMDNQKANFLIGRRSMPALKQTIHQMILDHLEDENLIEGEDYDHNKATSLITFENGSKITPLSWADKKYRKFRSYNFSSGLIEEGTENDEIDFYKEVKMRMGRVPHIKENFLVTLTNPDNPHHWLYEYFIAEQAQKFSNRHVYYSLTEQNPFLSESYIRGIKETLTEREALRMLKGQWIEIKSEVIYYAFDEDASLIQDYQIDPRYPVCIAYDFNIALGKPMSVVLFQRKGEHFYFFDEVVIHGSNTLQTLEEINMRGYFDIPNLRFKIQGDAAGKAKSSKSIQSDYDIIENYLNHLHNDYGPIQFEIDVPSINPPIRKRHVLVNGRLKNSFNETFIHVVKEKCPTLIKGFRLCKLKKGSQYIEDDSKEWQHITTAASYGICRELSDMDIGKRFNITK
jgi:PBSX family phage terminase large subunit